MVEGLCKIYKNLHNEKLFSKQGDKFKAIEDLLGDMDHYRECIDGFSGKEHVPEQAMKYFRDRYQHAKDNLNMLLLEKGWLSGKRSSKVRTKLQQAEWMEPKKEMQAVRKYYLSEIDELKALYKKVPVFKLIEDHLHEFRRRLRWFSIYPHAMQGAIQLEENAEVYAPLLKHQTPEVVSSRFNQFPLPAGNDYLLMLDKSSFLSLSWMIDALGKLKDKGLLEENLVDALNKTNLISTDSTPIQSKEEILREATDLARTFMDDLALDKLVGEVKPSTAAN